jgi:acetyltransferase-like isoleucine patch superfamily enzyme
LLFFANLRLRGIKIPTPMVLRGMWPRIHNDGTMEFGEDVRVSGRVTRCQFGTSKSGRLILGKSVGINEGVTIFSVCEITIGDDAMIADYVSIHDSDFHAVSPNDPVRVKPVKIGRNAWIGRNSIILSGVTIGENAVVAAGSVVTSNVAANTLVGGNPARLIRAFDVPASGHYVRREH